MEYATSNASRRQQISRAHRDNGLDYDHWERDAQGNYRPARKKTKAAQQRQAPEPAEPISLEAAKAKTRLAEVRLDLQRVASGFNLNRIAFVELGFAAFLKDD